MRNRQLKFRVWNPEQNKMEYFELDNITFPERLLTQDKYPVQQYTGMKDSKGVEIYEGDDIEFALPYNNKKCTGNIFYHDAFVVTGNSEDGEFVYAYLHELVKEIYNMKIKVIEKDFENDRSTN